MNQFNIHFIETCKSTTIHTYNENLSLHNKDNDYIFNSIEYNIAYGFKDGQIDICPRRGAHDVSKEINTLVSIYDLEIIDWKGYEKPKKSKKKSRSTH